jgi:hypothetical protein
MGSEMKQSHANASQIAHPGAPRRRRPAAPGGPPIQGEIRRLQATAGNAAVAASMEQLVVQRHDVAGGDGSQGTAQLPAPNPVVAALWKSSVLDPLHAAANAMSDEKPDYRTAFDQAGKAREATVSAARSLPADDPRKAKANYLFDDLTLTQTLLAPRADVTISTTDDQLASQLGGFEYDAAVVGESLGGDPAPRMKVVPGLGEEQSAGNQ